jgi:hypothetical protein
MAKTMDGTILFRRVHRFLTHAPQESDITNIDTRLCTIKPFGIALAYTVNEKRHTRAGYVFWSMPRGV